MIQTLTHVTVWAHVHISLAVCKQPGGAEKPAARSLTSLTLLTGDYVLSHVVRIAFFFKKQHLGLLPEMSKVLAVNLIAYGSMNVEFTLKISPEKRYGSFIKLIKV